MAFGTSLAAGTDLNTITVPGYYFCTSDDAAASMLNIPGNKTHFSLFVEQRPGNSGKGCVQTIKLAYDNGYDGDGVYIRSNARATADPTVWSPWVKMATAESPTEYLLPVTSDVSSSTSYYSKDQFGRVSLSINLGLVQPIAVYHDFGLKVGTLPVGFRPKVWQCFMCNLQSTQAGIESGIVTIGDDGSVYLKPCTTVVSGSLNLAYGVGVFLAV